MLRYNGSKLERDIPPSHLHTFKMIWAKLYFVDRFRYILFSISFSSSSSSFSCSSFSALMPRFFFSLSLSLLLSQWVTTTTTTMSGEKKALTTHSVPVKRDLSTLSLHNMLYYYSLRMYQQHIVFRFVSISI